MNTKTIKIIIIIFVALLSILLMSLVVKGDKGNPIYYQKEKDTSMLGPFEGSNSSSRYALTEAIVKNHSLFLNQNLAKFASPDVVDYQGKFITIFTPGISFLGVPFYIIGAYFGFPQLGAYAVNILFAFLNFYLITKLSVKLGANIYAGIISGVAFVFGTNAFLYALNYTQHIISTALILLIFLNILEKRNIWRNILLGLYTGMAFLMDIPNVFFIFPLLLYAFSKHINVQDIKTKIVVSFRLVSIAIVLGMLPVIMLFAWYNYQTTGSYTKLGQTIGRSKYFRDILPPQRSAEGYIKEESSDFRLLKTPFNTRNELNSSYILLLSNERSWLYYSPIVLLGVFGWLLIYKNKKNKITSVLAYSIIIINILIYSMFDDPWGGWAFGPRYLIPSAAILCAGIGILIDKYKNSLFMAIFFIVFTYSVFVSSTGAVTTTMIPPKVEAVNLKPRIPYTYKYNLDLIKKNKSGSLMYNIFFYKYMKLSEFTGMICFLIISQVVLLYLFSYKYNWRN